MTDPYPGIRDDIARYYAHRLMDHGPTFRGVDWSSLVSQNLRFRKLLEVITDPTEHCTLTDYGCGYGALLDVLNDRLANVTYQGYDLSPRMIEQAKALHHGNPAVTFGSNAENLVPTDYTVASGIFNVRLNTPAPLWEGYVRHTLDHMAGITTGAFAFNVLTAYSDLDKRRDDLYYGDPVYWFSYCRERFSPYVALAHDYPLYEFTIYVRLSSR